jgi:zinc protease
MNSSILPPQLIDIPILPSGVEVTTLENGLQIITREDHNAPVVSAQVWSRAGSIHEDKWLGAGLSHLLEHMLFKGTTTRAPGKIDQEVQDVGGYMNAYTSFDRTVYHIDAPNTGAAVAIEILCDIAQNATLPEEELVKEMDVIRREMDMGHDDPSSRSSRRLFETAFTRSPIRFPIIGYADIFNRVKRSDVLAYYREKYASNNLFFVVVGDIKHADVVAQIRTAFATTKAQPIPPFVLPEEPRQLAGRENIEEAPIEMVHMHYCWHTPELRHADIPILDVLATILGSGRSSRLFQEIREKKGLVVSADAWTYSPGSPGLFGMSAVIETEKFDAARVALLHEIERVKTELIPAHELAKAIKQFISAILATRKTMAGQAQDLGANWLTASDLNFSLRYLETVKRTTPADLQRVACQYLTSDNCTLFALVPEGTRQKVVHVHSKTLSTPIQKIELPGGLKLLLKEDHRLPFIELRAVARGGVLAEDAKNNGVALLTAKLLLKGTRTRTAEQIAREIESLGGSIDCYSANNSIGVNVEVMNGDFPAGLELMADVILNAAFPKDAFEREREVQLAAIKAQRDHLLQCAVKKMRQGLFGKTGYGLDVLGTEKTVKSLKTEDLAQLHHNLLAPDNCVMAIFGDVNAEAALAAVQKAFAGWQHKSQVPPMVPPAPLLETLRFKDTRDKKQAVLVVGFPGSTIYAQDRFALELLQESCSDLGSRLMSRIREKLGLAYYVGAQNQLGLTPGYFAFYVGTEPEKIAVCETEILKEVESLRNEGLTAEELKRSKAKLVGQKKIGRQDIGHHATQCALDELYGLGYQKSDQEDAEFEAVTLEQVKTVAQKYLTPDRMVISTVSPKQ